MDHGRIHQLAIPTLDPVVTTQAFFWLAASTVVSLNGIPLLKHRFITYGPRAASPVHPAPQDQPPAAVWRFLHAIAAVQVPHGFFLHFYVASVLSSGVWGVQLSTNGALLQFLRQCTRSDGGRMSMSVDQIALTWSLTMLSIPIFLLASGIQHDCHAYLASLKKYSLPDHPAFQILICPHYTAECLIYVSLAILSAPRGQWVNRTIFSALVFVVSNLAVTASNTSEWYRKKFGEEAVKYKWKMLPYIW